MSGPINSRVVYYYRDDVANFTYGEGHPMKPYRMRLAHHLIGGYGLLDKMAVFHPPTLSREDLVKFHAEDYIDFLREVRPVHQSMLARAEAEVGLQQELGQEGGGLSADVLVLQQQFSKYGVDGDCPIFEGLYQFCTIHGGGSVGGAWKLNRGVADICINWSGGLHHAKKAEVSGFCYTNDIVLAILELLRYHQRVLYIDIDVHHGDGVEEAFYCTDRVMTVSFHRHCRDGFFPCTGSLEDRGVGPGKNHALNFPMDDGITDQQYGEVFKTIIGAVMQNYRPEAIVLQCGADSLTGDKLGPFNLTLHGHGSCVEFCKGLGVPLLLLGGGGYTVKNVARAWTYETAIALGVHKDLSEELPFNDYIRYWGPDYKLHINPMAERVNKNTVQDLNSVQASLLQQLKELGGPPSVAYDTKVGHDATLHGFQEEREAAELERRQLDSVFDGAPSGSKQHAGEFYANNRDQDGSDMPASMGIVRAKPVVPLRNLNEDQPTDMEQ